MPVCDLALSLLHLIPDCWRNYTQ